MTVGVGFSWKEKIGESFKEIDRIKNQSYLDGICKRIEAISLSGELKEIESMTERLDTAVQKVFNNPPKVDEYIKYTKTPPRSLFWDAKQRRVFAICKPPFPSIHQNGGWKLGCITLMFDDEKRIVELVWSMELRDQAMQSVDRFTFKEQMLKSKYGDMQFWPKVYHGSFSRIEKLMSPSLDRVFLFTERYDCNLHDIFQKCRLEEDTLLTIVSQITAGLDFIHKHGMAHCDVKPANILIKKVAVLCDWDFLLEDKKSERLFGMYGTPHFASPECINEDEEITDFRPSDLYALGASLQSYLDPKRFHKLGFKKQVYFKFMRERPRDPDNKKFLKGILDSLKKMSVDSDLCLDKLKTGKIESDNYTKSLTYALLQTEAEKRPKSEQVVEWNSRYIKRCVDNIMESIRRTKDID